MYKSKKLFQNVACWFFFFYPACSFMVFDRYTYKRVPCRFDLYGIRRIVNDLVFYALSTVLKWYRDDGTVILNGSLYSAPYCHELNFATIGIRTMNLVIRNRDTNRLNELQYSRLSLSRPRLSRITAYLEVKIWSLFHHRDLPTGNKILWKRGEIAPLEQFLLFSTIFSIYL